MFFKTHFWVLSFLLLSSITALAEDGYIKGKITDTKTKDALIGVNVTSVDNLSGITDLDGNFEIKASEGKHILTFTYVGYIEKKQTVIVKANDTAIVDITLEDAAQNVLGNDLVITGSLYQKHASESR